MLSILIPVYNYDVHGLVSDLLSEIKSINDRVEICLLNDGSDEQWINQLDELAQSGIVSIHHFVQNQGRVASRNKLAELAQYDYLLFIDCDARVVSLDFISNYLKNLDKAQVIAGGHVYQDDMPESQYILHWKYGREIEVRSLEQRQERPFISFSTFNFCASKEMFSNYLTDINLNGYGHEDTVMGWILKSRGVRIQHIQNPLLHDGLKDNNQFLLDVSRAVKNAQLIYLENPSVEIKIIKFSNNLKKARLAKLTLLVLNRFEKIVMNNLKSSNPSLRYLQLYKLKAILELTILSAEATAKEEDN